MQATRTNDRAKYHLAHRLLASARGCALLLTAAAGFCFALASPVAAQPPAPGAVAPAAGSAVGTVKDIFGNALTLTLANSQTLSVQAADGARVVRLAPGSSNLKGADPIAFGDIAVGDRVLVRGAAGSSAGTFTATLLVVMKQQDIQQKQAADLLDWQRRGTGGLVRSVDPAAGTILISTVTAAGAGKLLIQTSPKTIYRRYSPGSVKFEDARLGSLSDLKPGDQLRVRGVKSDDGATMAADEIVSGTFLNIAGTITAVDAAGNTLTVHDLATGKAVIVRISPNTSLHKLSPTMAAMFAMRLSGAGAGGAASAGAPAASGTSPGVGQQAGAGRSGPGGFQGRGAGGGIAQAIAHTPLIQLSDLKPNDAVMIVATEAAASSSAESPSAGAATAVTLLAGVEPILAATPSNSRPMTLSPWTMGGDVPTE